MTARYASGFLVLMLIACGSGVTPPGAADPPADDGNPVEVTVSFASDIQPIFDASCAGSCHVEGGTAPFLPLEAGVSHANLVGQPATQTTGGGTLVVAGDSASSILLGRLEANGEGDPRMPGGGAEPLADTEMTAITTWIDEGALDN